jgi:Cu(I)/Ag(I) efflux system membrane protein CusA/SilA
MIDAAIVMIENAHKHLERLPEGTPRRTLRGHAGRLQGSGPGAVLLALIITVSFLPVFTLEGQEGRLFSPLAYTKTFSMAGAAILSVTLVPVLMLLFIRGKIMPEAKNPVNRVLIWVYRPIIAAVMRWKKLTIVLAVIVLAVSVYPASRLGSEFMPTLNEGTALHAGLPAGHVDHQGRRADADPGQDHQELPGSRIGLRQGRPRQHRHRPGADRDVRDGHQPQAASRMAAGHDDRQADRRNGQGAAVPGVANAWTMPIKARTDMLSTGIRTPIGIKVFGKDLDEMEKLAKEIEAVVKGARHHQCLCRAHHRRLLPQHRTDREQLARYGLAVGELQDVIGSALGGEMVTTTVEGRERFGVTVRYPRELRSDPQQIAREVLVPTMGARWCRWGSWRRSGRQRHAGHPHRERLLSAYIFVDIRDRDIGGYVADAKKAVAEQIKFPPGYYVTWSGQFEFMERAIEKMKVVIPITLLTIFLLLYLNFRRITETLIVMLSVPSRWSAACG